MDDSLQIDRTLNFTILMDHIIKDERLSKIGLLTYMAIASFAGKADKEGRKCWPSLSTIAKRGRMTRASAQKGVKELVNLGYLIKRNEKKENSKEYTSNRYTLLEGIPSSGTPCTTQWYTRIPPSSRELENSLTRKENTHSPGPACGGPQPALVRADEQDHILQMLGYKKVKGAWLPPGN